jgi:hypothetical protein
MTKRELEKLAKQSVGAHRISYFDLYYTRALRLWTFTVQAHDDSPAIEISHHDRDRVCRMAATALKAAKEKT